MAWSMPASAVASSLEGVQRDLLGQWWTGLFGLLHNRVY
jgi:hypothetical protein